MANDYEELLGWFEDEGALPRTVREANFQTDRFDTLLSRVSAAYKGINVLVLREGSKDWYWKATIQELNAEEIALDIHHIFPRKWCEGSNPKIGKDRYNTILNKTPISYRANRKMGGDAPSYYLPRLQREKQVAVNDSELDKLLASHALKIRFKSSRAASGGTLSLRVKTLRVSWTTWKLMQPFWRFKAR